MKSINIHTEPVDIGYGLILTRSEITKRFTALLDHIISLAQVGDPTSRRSLKQIHYLLEGDAYESVSPSVNRAFWFYKLMFELSLVIRPASSTQPGMITKPIVLDEDGKREYPEIYEWARRQWKPRSTLRSLTIRVFLAQLKKDPSDLNAIRSLQRDLTNFKRWEVTRPTELYSRLSIRSGEEIPAYRALNRHTGLIRTTKVKG